MKQAMEKWLNRHQITFSIDTAHSLCNSLGLDGENVDECLGLCYQLEKGNIDNGEFTAGLSLLTGKKPEEVAEVLRGMKANPRVIRYMTPEEEIEFPYINAIITDEGGIAFRKGLSVEEIASTIRHEIGHIKYPVVYEWDDKEKYLLSELCANYFSLKIDPTNPSPKILIRQDKEYAIGEGVPRARVEEIDTEARKMVGYTGKQVR